MRILGHVHRYPPIHCAGAEMMVHTLLRYMVSQGHEARVMARDGTQTGRSMNVQGVSVEPLGRSFGGPYRWADVVITHLDCTGQAVTAAGQAGKPLVHVVHNDAQLRFHRVRDAALVVFNSAWLAEEVAWPGWHVVVHPPVLAEEYRTTRGDAITLLNLTRDKGAEVFYELARRFPERSFLGVRGAYGHQVIPQKVPGNVTLLHHTPNVRDEVYARTRIVLMPSSYESWGRVAIEAAASGIPTIAHPTPGLLESLGMAGIYRDRRYVDSWVEVIERLEEPAEYVRASQAALARSKELDPVRECVRFAEALVSLTEAKAA